MLFTRRLPALVFCLVLLLMIFIGYLRPLKYLISENIVHTSVNKIDGDRIHQFLIEPFQVSALSASSKNRNATSKILTSPATDKQIPQTENRKTNNVVVSPKGWSYTGPSQLRCEVHIVGCFQPTVSEESKSLASVVFEIPNLTDWKCIEFCLKRSGRKVQSIGLRNGNGCKCASYFSYSHQLDESECQEPCSGDRTRTCGGRGNVTMVYLVVNKCEMVSNVSMVVGSNSLLGCYHKPTLLSSTMEEYTLDKDFLPERCVLQCERVGLVLAIPQGQNLCYCGLTTKSFNLSNPVLSSPCIDNAKDYVTVYQTLAEDRRCGKKRFLKEGELNRKIGLVTFPGSGNTWLRYLIEATTGIYTGSVYHDMMLQIGGFIGQHLPAESFKFAVIKSHNLADIPDAGHLDGIISVYRNPYDVLLAEFNRRHRGHTGVLSPKDFKKKRQNFEKFLSLMVTQWRRLTESIVQSPLPKLMFSFEDLKNDTLVYAEKMARFILRDSIEESDLRKRLSCLRLSRAGHFKREKRLLGFDPYTKNDKMRINEEIKRLEKTMKDADLGPLPGYQRDPT